MTLEDILCVLPNDEQAHIISEDTHSTLFIGHGRKLIPFLNERALDTEVVTVSAYSSENVRVYIRWDDEKGED